MEGVISNNLLGLGESGARLMTTVHRHGRRSEGGLTSR